MVWPEPDLPRTSTGKVRRKAVAAWLAEIQATSAVSGMAICDGPSTRIWASSDWLLALIVAITVRRRPAQKMNCA